MRKREYSTAAWPGTVARTAFHSGAFGPFRSLFSTLAALFLGTHVFGFQGEPPKLPSGPSGPGRFGAYSLTLDYTPEWDRLWPVADHADVVIRFEDGGQRLVFWRGTNYVPCWATPEGIWFTSGFFERRGGPSSGTTSMVEPISDKRNRYSRVRVLENSEARVVVHWRYAPVDLDYTNAFVDPVTGWGDWVDEYYTIYPDSVAVRKATLRSSALDEWLEYQESIVVNPPGTRPEDNIENGAIILANSNGESSSYDWTEEGGPRLTDPPGSISVEIVNLKSTYKPFTVVEAGDVTVASYTGRSPVSRFNFWNHWPVSLARSDTTVARGSQSASHTSLTHIEWKPFAEDSESRTWIMLNGLTDQGLDHAARLSRSWNSASKAEILGNVPAKIEGFDKSQRAYVLQWEQPDVPAPLPIRVESTAESPSVNPAFLINGWGRHPVEVFVDGQALARPLYRQGYANGLGIETLVVWIRKSDDNPFTLEFRPRD